MTLDADIAVEANFTEEIFGVRRSLTKSFDIDDVCGWSEIVMCNNNSKFEMFIQLYDEILCAIKKFELVDDSIEFAAHFIAFVIVCDLCTELGAQVSHDESMTIIVETAVLVRQSEVAPADAHIKGKNNVADDMIDSEDQIPRSSWTIAESKLKIEQFVQTCFVNLNEFRRFSRFSIQASFR